MNNIKDKFLGYGIPYDDIDPEMIDVLDAFNFHLGLKTKFCCYGHMPHEQSYLVFDECVTDDQILNLAEHTSPFIDYYKWVRCSPVKINWICRMGAGYKDPNDEMKLSQLKMIVARLNKINLM